MNSDLKYVCWQIGHGAVNLWNLDQEILPQLGDLKLLQRCRIHAGKIEVVKIKDVTAKLMTLICARKWQVGGEEELIPRTRSKSFQFVNLDFRESLDFFHLFLFLSQFVRCSHSFVPSCHSLRFLEKCCFVELERGSFSVIPKKCSGGGKISKKDWFTLSGT